MKNLGHAIHVYAGRVIIEAPLEIFSGAGTVAILQAQAGAVQMVQSGVGRKGEDQIQIAQSINVGFGALRRGMEVAQHANDNFPFARWF